MKRNKFIKHLSENNCELHRNGSYSLNNSNDYYYQLINANQEIGCPVRA